jgi:hypothetical protein
VKGYRGILLQLLLPICLMLAAPADAQAYLDPGTGSILLQGLIAAVAAAVMVLRGRWIRLRDFLFRRGRKPEVPTDRQPQDEP